MIGFRTALWGIGGLLVLVGCTAAPKRKHFSTTTNRPVSALTTNQDPSGVSSDRDSTIRQVAYQQPPSDESSTNAREKIVASAEAGLSLEQFVAEVRLNHPSVQAMRAAWQAAAQRNPQVVALDDPVFMMMTAPQSLESSSVAEGAYALQINQKFPGIGKRAAKGKMASAESAAAGHDVSDTQLQLDLVATNAFLDYYFTDRQVELNELNHGLAQQFRATAQTKYRTNQVTQQDVLQAEVEVVEFERRGLELKRMHRTAIARLNTLLLRAPQEPLPTPEPVSYSATLETDEEELQQMALQQRPDLAALCHRVEVEEASLDLAWKQYNPDVEVFGRYDTFWQPSSTQGDLRGQVGVSINLPVYHRKLNAAVCEAYARVQQRRAEYQLRVLDVQYEVQAAIERIRESQQALKLFSNELLPAARQNMEAAQTNYEVGKGTFQELIQAQRQLIMVREKWLEAQVDFARRRGEINRAVGIDYASARERENAPITD